MISEITRVNWFESISSERNVFIKKNGCGGFNDRDLQEYLDLGHMRLVSPNSPKNILSILYTSPPRH